MRNFIQNIRSKPEDHRRKVALGMSLTITAFIFVGWLSSKGWIGFTPSSDSKLQTAQVIQADKAISPIKSTSKTFKEAGDQIKAATKEFTDTISQVFVPFVTGIEIYQRK